MLLGALRLGAGVAAVLLFSIAHGRPTSRLESDATLRYFRPSTGRTRREVPSFLKHRASLNFLRELGRVDDAHWEGVEEKLSFVPLQDMREGGNLHVDPNGLFFYLEPTTKGIEVQERNTTLSDEDELDAQGVLGGQLSDAAVGLTWSPHFYGERTDWPTLPNGLPLLSSMPADSGTPVDRIIYLDFNGHDFTAGQVMCAPRLDAFLQSLSLIVF